jgi:hypothetical protein
MREEVSLEPASDEWFDSTPAPTLAFSYLLGDLLMGKGLITNSQLENALATQQRMGGLLGEILVADGALTMSELEEALREQEGLGDEATSHLHPFGTSRYGAA